MVCLSKGKELNYNLYIQKEIGQFMSLGTVTLFKIMINLSTSNMVTSVKEFTTVTDF